MQDHKKDEKRTSLYKNDGTVEVSISDDGMTALGVFSPPVGGGKPLDLEYMEKVLQAEGIVHGVDWDTIRETIFECNTEHRRKEGVVIAKGTPAEPEVPAHIQLQKRFFKPVFRVEDEQSSIDFKAISPIILVKRGEVLGVVVPKKSGTEGTDVKGQVQPFPKKEVVQLNHGENTVLKDGKVLATISGQFSKKDNTFWVSDTLEIKGSVDYHTGHVSFPGDVTITGEIKDGFRVFSGGSITCKGTMDASLVLCKKNLIIHQGIIGRQPGLVRVGGDIQAKFAENCTLETRGSIMIKSALLNCKVFTLESLKMAEKGKIVGGEVHAGNGVVTNELGTPSGTLTEIHCGIDFVIERKLKLSKEKHLALGLKLQQAERLLKKGPNPRLEQTRQQIFEESAKLSAYISSLLEKLYKNEEAEILVRDTVYPGVMITICKVSYVVTKEMTKSRFHLDKTKGKIVVEQIS